MAYRLSAAPFAPFQLPSRRSSGPNSIGRAVTWRAHLAPFKFNKIANEQSPSRAADCVWPSGQVARLSCRRRITCCAAEDKQPATWGPKQTTLAIYTPQTVCGARLSTGHQAASSQLPAGELQTQTLERHAATSARYNAARPPLHQRHGDGQTRTLATWGPLKAHLAVCVGATLELGRAEAAPAHSRLIHHSRKRARVATEEELWNWAKGRLWKKKRKGRQE